MIKIQYCIKIIQSKSKISFYFARLNVIISIIKEQSARCRKK
ncbi:hypothetical protein CLOSYM_01086 [[Clostridium] symbiosum ATCC 14940]|uniref:Uncharacterized protein n=1 Tax=[Clostridium] symbiosum ATCC 14940 TaxID=411472 RepID=A0ABC9U1C0_CLOSY|nr:hypothetical protein CLOSYM_01086 [[Clostridium] symbiosum ATCC 14940]